MSIKPENSISLAHIKFTFNYDLIERNLPVLKNVLSADVFLFLSFLLRKLNSVCYLSEDSLYSFILLKILKTTCFRILKAEIWNDRGLGLENVLKSAFLNRISLFVGNVIS